MGSTHEPSDEPGSTADKPLRTVTIRRPVGTNEVVYTSTLFGGNSRRPKAVLPLGEHERLAELLGELAATYQAVDPEFGEYSLHIRTRLSEWFSEEHPDCESPYDAGPDSYRPFGMRDFLLIAAGILERGYPECDSRTDLIRGIVNTVYDLPSLPVKKRKPRKGSS